jgi:hypothetical protein
MTTTPRQPFSVRIGLTEPYDEAPYDGVPRHLVGPLRDWVGRQFREGLDDTATAVCLRLRLTPPSPNASARTTLMCWDGMELLDVVDTILGWEDQLDEIGGDEGGDLARMLDYAGSAYRVNDASNGLEVRISPPVREAVSQTISDAAGQSSAGSAAEHLAAAWQAAYGMHP